VTLFPPEQVLVKAEAYGTDGDYVRFAARMAYVNAGRTEYPAIVRRESVTIQMGKEIYRQSWQMYQTFDATNDHLEMLSRNEAHPETITGGSSVSHETYFAPRSDLSNSFLEWGDFVEKLERAGSAKFVFVADFYKDKQRRASCVVRANADLLERLRKRKWAAPPCVE